MEWRIETHLHTRASDGEPTPAEAVRAARARGLAAVAVTDHDTLAGIPQAISEASRLGVTVVPGVEVRTVHGDVLVLCTSAPDGDPPRRPSIPELAEWASANACILVAAHPYHPVRSSMGGRALRENARYWAAVEGWNARGLPPFNWPALKAAGELGLPATSGSDAHVIHEIGIAPIVLESEPRSPEDVVEAIASGGFRAIHGIPGARALLAAFSWGLRRRVNSTLSRGP